VAEQCIWTGAPGRSGNVHVSGSAYHVGPASGFDRAAVCDACGQTVGVFVNGQWFVVLHNARGRISYEKAPFAQFGVGLGDGEAQGSAPVVGKKLRV